MNLDPSIQLNLYEHSSLLNHFSKLYKINKLPNKILLSGEKGVGKCTFAYHLINLILSENEDLPYDINNNLINNENTSFKLIQNKSCPNFNLIDITENRKNINIDQIRDLIINLNKSSFNNKPRFVLIDNIEFLNTNSINALLKVLEDPNYNIYFILINNNKNILKTLLSRCINFKIYLTNKESIAIANKLLNGKLKDIVNEDLISYYVTPGIIFNLVKFADNNKYDLLNFSLSEFLKVIIKEKHYKKDELIKHIFFDLI